MRERKKRKKYVPEELAARCRASKPYAPGVAVYHHCGKLAEHPGPHYDSSTQQSWT